MGAFYGRPPTVIPQYGHPILKSESLWLVCDSDNPPQDILNRGYAAMGIGALAHSRNQPSSGWGAGFNFSISGTNAISMGTTNRFLASDTTPCSIMWCEQVKTLISVHYGIMEFRVTGTPDTVFVGRFTDMAWGMATGVARNVLFTSLAPPVASQQSCAFLLVGTAGCRSNTPADWKIYMAGSSGFITVPGTALQTETSTGISQLGLAPSIYNNLFLGSLENIRIWNRALSNAECLALMQDPYLGCLRDFNGNGEPS